MERDLSALDGLLRELARAPEGSDDAFVARVMARTRRRTSLRSPLLIAASFLLATGLPFALAPEAPTARLGLSGPACVGAKDLRVLIEDKDSGRLLLLGQTPIGMEVRVPAGVPLRIQTVGHDGMALWTSPEKIELRPNEAKSSPGRPVVALDARKARPVAYASEIKPILDQHCSGCHTEAELLKTAKPFEARRSALVLQTHAPLPESARRELALWVDLGAFGRP